MRLPDGHDSLRNLFRQEMRSLQEEGRVFAQEYPEAAGLLDPSRVEDRDPGVERLVEAFGVLNARVRQAAAMEEDGLAGHLLKMFEDGLDRILPSVLVFQATPRRRRMEAVRLEPGTELKAGGFGAERCRFTLGHPLRVDPLRIRMARVEIDERGKSHLELELVWSGRATDGWPDPLPVFLHGDAPVVWALRYGLARRVEKIEVQTENGWVPAPGLGFRRMDMPGYGGDTHAHPLSDARDFFCCDERFRFVELHGLAGLGRPAGGRLRIRVGFDGAFPRAVVRGVSAEVFRLNVGIAINRYEDTCDGLVWDHTRTELPLRMARTAGREVVEVLQVESLTQSRPSRRTVYHPFSRYREGNGVPTGFFQVRHREDSLGRPMTLLSLGWPDLGMRLEEESVVALAAFCDGNRPYDESVGRDLSASRRSFPEGLELVSLTRASPVHRSPGTVELHTRLMTLSAAHFQGTLDAKRMRDTLRLFLWDPAEAKRTLIDALQEVSVETGLSNRQGIHRPEMRVRIRLRDTTCTPDTWDRLGVLDAFAGILGLLAEEETPIGSGFSTTVVVEPAGVELRV